MPNNYIPQPIVFHEVQGRQHFRSKCKPYENVYLRAGTALALPNILIKRLTTGVAISVTIVGLNEFNYGAVANPGFALSYLDAPVNAYEVAVFDRGNWTLPVGLPDGTYYLKANSGLFQWWSDEITIMAAGDLPGYPPECPDGGYLKLRWRQPKCIFSGKSTDSLSNVLAYPTGMDFFVFLKAAALIAAEWENTPTYQPTGSGGQKVEKRFAVKRWKLKGGAVSEAIIDAMQSSAFFDFGELYFPGLADPLLNISDIIVEASTADNGCTYEYDYTFIADHLSKQGCCP